MSFPTRQTQNKNLQRERRLEIAEEAKKSKEKWVIGRFLRKWVVKPLKKNQKEKMRERERS